MKTAHFLNPAAALAAMPHPRLLELAQTGDEAACSEFWRRKVNGWRADKGPNVVLPADAVQAVAHLLNRLGAGGAPEFFRLLAATEAKALNN